MSFVIKYGITLCSNNSRMVFLLAYFICTSLTGCDEANTLVDTKSVVFEIGDVTCTESFIRIAYSESLGERNVVVKRDGATIFSLNGSHIVDTTITDRPLRPSTKYVYRLSIDNTTLERTVVTKDTTTHTWSVQTQVFAEPASYLWGVYVINDSLAYAVGGIYINDTLYNALEWDGKSWNPMQVQLVVPCNGVLIVPSLECVWGYDGGSTYFSDGGSVARYAGMKYTTDCRMTALLSGAIYAMYGVNESDMFVAGENGTMIHYDGNGWLKENSSTSLHIKEVAGRKGSLYAVGISTLGDEGIIIKYHNGTWHPHIRTLTGSTGYTKNGLFNRTLYGSLEGIWVDESDALYAVGGFAYRYKNERWEYLPGFPENEVGTLPRNRGYLTDIDGNAHNDILVVGEYGTIRHFNGSTWTSIGGVDNFPDTETMWQGVSMKGRLCAVIGRRRGEAILLTMMKK